MLEHMRHDESRITVLGQSCKQESVVLRIVMEDVQVLAAQRFNQDRVRLQADRTGWQTRQQLARATSEIDARPGDIAQDVPEVWLLDQAAQRMAAAAQLLQRVVQVELGGRWQISVEHYPVDQQPQHAVQPGHDLACGNVHGACAEGRVRRHPGDEVAKVRALLPADRDAPRTARNAKRRQALAQIICVSVQEQPEPIVEIDYVRDVRIEFADPPCQVGTKQDSSRLADEVGAAPQAAAYGAAARYDAASAARISPGHDGATIDVDHGAGTEHQSQCVLPIGREHVYLACKAVRSQKIVLRQKLEVASAGQLQAAVPVFLGAQIALVAQKTDARIEVARDYLRRLVGRVVVNDDQLEIGKTLSQH